MCQNLICVRMLTYMHNICCIMSLNLKVLRPGLDMKGSESYSAHMFFPLERDGNGGVGWDGCVGGWVVVGGGLRVCSFHGEHWCHDSHAGTCPYKVHSGLLHPNRWLTELSSRNVVTLPVSLQGFAWTWDKCEYVCRTHGSKRHRRNPSTIC